ncbi:MAG: hypothetical protein ACYCZN_01240 [Candidatus Dormibacteria bacterium]
MARAVDRHEAAKLLTEAEWAAARAEPCGMCGEPYHRFCDHDPEHEWDAIACINSLREHVERLEKEVRGG